MARNTESKLKSEIFALIKENQESYLATSLNNQPFVRPLILFYAWGRFWYISLKNEAKTAQLKNNNKVEVCIPLRDSGHTGYIRASGIAKIIKDHNLRYDAIDFCYFFDEYFEGADDPNYILIELLFDQMELMRPGESYSEKVNL
ncbi:MAG: pyridoxamine 5'-phosphate oxidase family protein [Candidatus Cloacimonadales bacterium]|jgi:general stress protein 26|nr:pyridoxamine 5'-phosphate oxidase family protein [Candidatus Cloacimonadota bacterium]MDD2651011.1 pyridoxamine 5'-phosphate oxidase family protein [Candidatus Cloacimonadota bacterium]MDD3501948.1 pyridoxamine 5'-phosphate oxidase family protein [Candidatus Cloacimonadota bacterium]MDX9978200.1 pyridoxamine 5'-phosphate oxidase family protein [Candidatus Cloacimonadales bacterium]